MKTILYSFLLILILTSCSDKNKPERFNKETFFVSDISYVDSITADYTVSTKTWTVFKDVPVMKNIPDTAHGVRIHNNIFHFWAIPGKFKTGDTIEWSRVFTQPKVLKDTSKKFLTTTFKPKKDTIYKNSWKPITVKLIKKDSI